MQKPHNRIVSFIGKHHVLTLATSGKEGPWCSNMFYAYMPEENLFIFTSDLHTRHAGEATANPAVAGSIVLETRIVGKVKGLQFTGTMTRPEGELAVRAKRVYLKKFPYAIAAPLVLWTLEPNLIKLTDNTLGFGKKLIWQKDESTI